MERELPGNQPLRLMAAFALAALLGGVLLLSRRWPAPASTPSSTPSPSVGAASEDVLTSAIEGLTLLAQSFDVHPESRPSAVDSESNSDHEPQPQSQDACSWWPGAKHNANGLTGMFLFGHLHADDLWRHPLLNPRDRAPCRPERDEFDELLRQIGRHLDAAADRCSVVKLGEMVDIARTGIIPPYDAEPVSDAELRMQARITAESRREMGLEADEQAILESLRSAGIRRPSGVSHVAVDGKFYLASAFESLPRTDAAFDAVRMCAAQAALAVMGYFIAHGYCAWDARMDAALEQIMTRPSTEHRPTDAGTPHPAAGR